MGPPNTLSLTGHLISAIWRPSSGCWRKAKSALSSTRSSLSWRQRKPMSCWKVVLSSGMSSCWHRTCCRLILRETEHGRTAQLSDTDRGAGATLLTMLPQYLWREFNLADLFGDLQAPGAVHLHGLHGAARALALAACHVGTGRPLLVLCRTDEVATS